MTYPKTTEEQTQCTRGLVAWSVLRAAAACLVLASARIQ